MKYLLIENKGEIHLDALTLMGGSTKRENKELIGHFGSGNKYSIAVLLKNNINFKIFSGEKEILISTKEYPFRSTVLHKVYINDVETNLTTEMGPDWEVWMAIREWYSNSLDEGGSNVVLSTEIIEGKADKTRIYIELSEKVQEIVNDWENYFTQDRVDCIEQVEKDKIFPNTDNKDNLVVFRKGIRCYKADGSKALYSYDLWNVKINESRVVANTYEAKQLITKCLDGCTNERIIKNILQNAHGQNPYYETNLAWDSWILPGKLNNTWKKAIGTHHIIVSSLAGWFAEEQQRYPCYIVELELATRIKKSFPDVIVYGLLDDGKLSCNKKPVTLSPKMEFLLGDCMRFFSETKYSIDYPIEIVSFEKHDQLGAAEEGVIYISEKLFDMGKREIAVCIIEENEHLKTGYKDCSRTFQQHFINKYISEKEERFGFFL
jgi:hypothetical protein